MFERIARRHTSYQYNERVKVSWHFDKVTMKFALGSGVDDERMKLP
jgi:hypothetical protein